MLKPIHKDPDQSVNEITEGADKSFHNILGENEIGSKQELRRKTKRGKLKIVAG